MHMLHTGLVSVTFRNLSPSEIISLVAEAGLEGIEWGGDVHAPPGNAERAREIRQATLDVGLKVASYGSYYRAGCGHDFAGVLETAVALGAPTIRIWAGDKGTDKADEAWWDIVVQDIKSVTAQAKEAGIAIALEYHSHTLTDGPDQAIRLLELVDDANLYIYWQPVIGVDVDSNAETLRRFIPFLANIHMFHWEPGVRLTMEEGIAPWQQYLTEVRGLREDRFVMLEFVQNDDPAQFLKDAGVLKQLLG